MGDLDPELATAIAFYDNKAATDRASLERWEKAQDAIRSLLSWRWELVSSSRLATDDFSLGYVVGCADTVMEIFRLDREAPEAIASHFVVFAGLFGTENGARYLTRVLRSRSSEMERGAKLGGEDALEFAAHGKCEEHWLKHVHGFRTSE